MRTMYLRFRDNLRSARLKHDARDCSRLSLLRWEYAADSAARVRPAQPCDGTRKFLQTYVDRYIA